MPENNRYVNKRGTILLTIIFATVFSIISITTTAHSNEQTSFNTQSIKIQLDTLSKSSLNRNTNYEDLTRTLHEINLLQSQITLCTETGQTQLDKINNQLHKIELSKAIKRYSHAYDYLLKEKDEKQNQVILCDFFNYRLEEIRATATDKIDKVSKSKLLTRTIDWHGFNPNLLFTLHLSAKTLYHYIGFEHITNMQWVGLTLIFMLGWLLAISLLKSSAPHTTLSNIISRQFISFALPVGLACFYLNIIFLSMTPVSTLVMVINALSIYVVTLFITKLWLTRCMISNPWLSSMWLFQVIMFVATNFHIIIIQSFLFRNIPLPLKLVNFVDFTYIIVVARLALAFMDTCHQWLTEKHIVTIQKRVYIIATSTLLAYTVYTILHTQPLPPQFFSLLDALCITLLNLAYFWIISAFLNYYLADTYHKIAQIILKIICMTDIVAAWYGYHYLAVMLIPNLIATVVIIVIMMDVNKLLQRIYFLLSDPSQAYSQKFRYLLGIRTEKKLIELYVIRLILTIPVIFLGLLSALEIWGVTRYQVSLLIIAIHGGVSILGTTILPTMVLRAASVFCVIVLSGRALATYVVRTNLLTEEKHTQTLLFSLVHYISYAIGLLMALYIAGLDLRSLVVVAGALSVGLGFGLQSFARDFISGLIIMLNKPIKIGDHIEVGDRNKNEGFIHKIGALSTQLHTLSHADVIIPNSEIITKVITNFTFHSNSLSGINITVHLDKNSDFESTRQLMLDIASKNPNVLKEPPYQPVVLFELYDLTLWCVINDVNKKETISSELNFAIANALKSMPGNEQVGPCSNA